MEDMTREKAADLLDNLIGMFEDNQDNDYDAALRMGIEALTSVYEVARAIATIIENEQDMRVILAREKGRWVEIGYPWYKCSQCGAVREKGVYLENYCPNCGADMRGEQDG